MKNTEPNTAARSTVIGELTNEHNDPHIVAKLSRPARKRDKLKIKVVSRNPRKANTGE